MLLLPPLGVCKPWWWCIRSLGLPPFIYIFPSSDNYQIAYRRNKKKMLCVLVEGSERRRDWRSQMKPRTRHYFRVVISPRPNSWWIDPTLSKKKTKRWAIRDTLRPFLLLLWWWLLWVEKRIKKDFILFTIFKSKFRSSTHRATGLKLSNHPRITRYFSYRPETKGALPYSLLRESFRNVKF
jgi:hypothetical protein